MKIEVLNSEYEESYEKFLLKNFGTLFFVSNKYRKFLKEFLQSEDLYFLAINDNGEIVGALPSFLKRNKKYGNVINSLPFYGSNGAVVEFNGNTEVKKNLLEKFYQNARADNCISSTIITSPLDNNVEFYENNCPKGLIDKRIGQIVDLSLIKKNPAEELMDIFHSKTRNMIRKAEKSELKISVDNSEAAWDFLIKTHIASIKALNGIPKPERFFKLIPKYFESGKDYKIWIALNKDETPIAALLCFYFNKTVEYFTPVVVEEYRSIQPLSLLVYQAMIDAVKQGYYWWNFGGTWLTQDGVYHFKKRWGTEDKYYYYLTNLFNENILKLPKEELLKEYPYFYVVPFNQLKNE